MKKGTVLLEKLRILDKYKAFSKEELEQRIKKGRIKGEDGVFFVHNYDGKINNYNPSLIDIAPTILYVLGINVSGFKGLPGDEMSKAV